MRNEAGEFTTPVPEWMHRLKSLDDQLTAMLAVDRAKDARIKFLEKALEQAISACEMRLHHSPDGAMISMSVRPVVYSRPVEERIDAAFKPELAAYLRERDSRPPSSGVQSGVQGEQGNEETA